jgi:stage IV sporulation protein FB
MKLGKVDISYGFIILISVLYYLDTQNLFLLLLLAAAIHEAGHFFVIIALGGNIGRLQLTGAGAVMEIEGGAMLSYSREIAATVAGPAANTAAALLASLLGSYYSSEAFFEFSGINIAFAVFNMLPVRQLDGGKTVYLLISCLSGPQEADTVCNITAYVFIILLYAAGLYALYITDKNFTIIATAVWLMFTARSENGIVNRRAIE